MMTWLRRLFGLEPSRWDVPTMAEVRKGIAGKQEPRYRYRWDKPDEWKIRIRRQPRRLRGIA
jgi:hypothetical protein